MNMTAFIHILSVFANLLYIRILNVLAEKTIGPYKFKKRRSYVVVIWLIIYMKISDKFHLSFAIMTVLYVVWHIVYFLILYSSDIRHCIAGSLYLVVANMIAETFAYMLIRVVTDFSGDIGALPVDLAVSGMALSKIILLILVYIYICICCNVWKRKYVKSGKDLKENNAFQNRQEIYEESLSYFFGGIYVPFLTGIVLVGLAYYIEITQELIIIFSAVLLINICSYYQYCNKEIDKVNMHMYKGMENLSEKYREYAVRSNEAWQNMRVFRHDMKKQYLLEKTYLEDGRYSELKKEYERNMDIMMPHIRICGLPIIDAVVSFGVTHAGRKNVVFMHDIQLPADIYVDDYDMNKLLGNIIDNAVNAAEKVVADGKKSGSDVKATVSYVKLICKYNEGNMYIECENSCSSAVEVIKRYSRYKYNINNGGSHHNYMLLFNGNNLKSSMSGQEHGLGIDIILRIVEAYKGTVETVLEEKNGQQIFILRIMLYDVIRNNTVIKE